MNRRYFLGAALSAASTPAFRESEHFDRPRILSFHHLHTEDRIDVVYRIGERYQQGALQQLNYFFRDSARVTPSPWIPGLLDLLYDVKNSLGDPDARFEVISAYRSPETNSKLRRSSSGVAKNSLHLTGQAMDVRFPDLPTRYIRDAAIDLGRGGVGYYPALGFRPSGYRRRQTLGRLTATPTASGRSIAFQVP